MDGAKKYGDKKPVDLVAEAEKIVANSHRVRTAYREAAATRELERKKKKNAEFDALLNVVMVLSCLTLAWVIALNFL